MSTLKILLLSPLLVPSGNFTTISRIRCHIEKNGWACELASPDDFPSSGSLTDFLRDRGVTLVIAIHAYRAGRVVSGCSVPYILILGGTDLNECSRYPDRLLVMEKAVHNASHVIAFSQSMMDKFFELWLDYDRERTSVVAQAIQVNPSDFNIKEFIKDKLPQYATDAVITSNDDDSLVLDKNTASTIYQVHHNKHGIKSHDLAEQSHDQIEQLHDLSELTYDHDEQLHDLDEQSDDFDEQSHDLDEQSHDCDEQSHDLDEQSHDCDEQSHDLDEQSDDFDEQSHDLDEQSHDLDEQSRNLLQQSHDHSSSSKKLHGIDSSLKLFTIVGGIRPVKNPLFLVKAFSEWRQRKALLNCVLLFVGPKMDEDYFTEFQNTLSGCPGVIHIPELDISATHSTIRDSFVLVNSSESEGMAAAILEAMSLGTPVLARNIQGNRVTVDDGKTGLLFENPEEFLTKVELLLTNADLVEKLTHNAMCYISQQHSLEVEETAYLSIIKRLLKCDV